MNSTKLGVALSLLALAGCSTNQTWERVAGEPSERDVAVCRMKATEAKLSSRPTDFGQAVAVNVSADAIFRDCMAAMGYRRLK